MFEPYKPKKFCKEYVNILTTSNQLPMFMAVVKGVKPLMDEWVPVNKFQEFKQMCKSYGLICQADCIFQEPNEEQLTTAVDGNTLTTTKALGVPYSTAVKEGRVHAFISKSSEQINKAHRFGWYPIIAGNRVINKPFVDFLRFGKVLGFPDCCIDFFKKYNNWKIYNHPYEILKNTKGKPSYYCNNILMDFNYFLIHHHPCSFNCKSTIRLAKEVEKAIKEEEPEFAEKIKEYTKLPLLVFREKKSYIFRGKIENNKIMYNDICFIGDRRDNIYEEYFRNGNMAKVGDSIEIYNNEELVFRITKESEPYSFILNFE